MPSYYDQFKKTLQEQKKRRTLNDLFNLGNQSLYGLENILSTGDEVLEEPSMYFKLKMKELDNRGTGQTYIDKVESDMEKSFYELKNELPEATEKVKDKNTFDEFLQDPIALADIDLNSALFMAGKSLGFDADSLNLSDPYSKKARVGNLMRGIGAAGKSLLNVGRLVGQEIGRASCRERVCMFV